MKASNQRYVSAISVSYTGSSAPAAKQVDWENSTKWWFAKRGEGLPTAITSAMDPNANGSGAVQEHSWAEC